MMDQLSTERLASIVAKEVHELTQEDIGFLFARREYLDDIDVQRFQSVLSQPVPQTTQQAPIVKLDRWELIRKAKELGIKVEKTMTAPQLKALIDDAIAMAEANEELDTNSPEGEQGDSDPVQDATPQNGHGGNFQNSDKYQPKDSV